MLNLPIETQQLARLVAMKSGKSPEAVGRVANDAANRRNRALTSAGPGGTGGSVGRDIGSRDTNMPVGRRLT